MSDNAKIAKETYWVGAEPLCCNCDYSWIDWDIDEDSHPYYCPLREEYCSPTGRCKVWKVVQP